MFYNALSESLFTRIKVCKWVASFSWYILIQSGRKNKTPTSVRVTSRQKLFTKVIYFSCIADLVCDWFSYPLKRNRFQHWHQMPKWKLIFRNILKNAWKYTEKWNCWWNLIGVSISLNLLIFSSSYGKLFLLLLPAIICILSFKKR